MKSVIVRLQEYESQASVAEKSIIRFLLRNPDLALGCSVQQLAEKSFSSPSTVVRLCQKAGFDGYKDFQKSLTYEVAIRKDNSLEMQRDIKKEDSLEDIVTKVTYKNIVSLENTRKLLDMEILRQCVDLIERSKTIGLFGIGSSLLVARDAYLKFLRINKSCFSCDDWHAQLLHAKNMTKEDVAIIISYSGFTEEMIICAKAAKANGTPLIAITRFEESELAKIVDYKLYIAATELIVRSGAMSSRIAQLDIIDILYTAYLHRHYDESFLQFQKTHIHKVYEQK